MSNTSKNANSKVEKRGNSRDGNNRAENNNGDILTIDARKNVNKTAVDRPLLSDLTKMSKTTSIPTNVTEIKNINTYTINEENIRRPE